MHVLRLRTAPGYSLGLCLPALLLAAVPQAVAQIELRYPLGVGDTLSYELRERVGDLRNPAAPQAEFAFQVRTWVLEAQGDQHTLLLERVRITAAGDAETLDGALLALDPRGVLRLDPEFELRAPDLSMSLALFPSGSHVLQVEPVWLTEPDLFGRQWRCTRVGPDAARGDALRVDFTQLDPTGASDVLKQSLIGAFWYDPKHAGLTRLEALAIDPAARQRRETIAVLRDRGTVNPAWLEKRRLELQRLLRSLRLEDRACEELLRPGANVEQILARVDRLWNEFDYEFPAEKDSPIRRLGAASRRRFASRADPYRARAAIAAQWVGKPAPTWSLLTERGAQLASESVRDRPTIECLWTAGGVESLRALEALRRLQRDIPDDVLHIVCMNIDGDAPAAQRAIELAGGNLRHVLLGPPVGGAPTAELPLLRLIDRQGNVRALLAGWSPGWCASVTQYLPETREGATCH